jgi:hypothetical protein
VDDQSQEVVDCYYGNEHRRHNGEPLLQGKNAECKHRRYINERVPDTKDMLGSSPAREESGEITGSAKLRLQGGSESAVFR